MRTLLHQDPFYQEAVDILATEYPISFRGKQRIIYFEEVIATVSIIRSFCLQTSNWKHANLLCEILHWITLYQVRCHLYMYILHLQWIPNNVITNATDEVYTIPFIIKIYKVFLYLFVSMVKTKPTTVQKIKILTVSNKEIQKFENDVKLNIERS